MRNVILYMSMSLDGSSAATVSTRGWPRSDDPHASPMNDIVETTPFPSGVVVQVYRPRRG